MALGLKHFSSESNWQATQRNLDRLMLWYFRTITTYIASALSSSTAVISSFTPEGLWLKFGRFSTWCWINARRSESRSDFRKEIDSTAIWLMVFIISICQRLQMSKCNRRLCCAKIWLSEPRILGFSMHSSKASITMYTWLYSNIIFASRFPRSKSLAGKFPAWYLSYKFTNDLDGRSFCGESWAIRDRKRFEMSRFFRSL